MKDSIDKAQDFISTFEIQARLNGDRIAVMFEDDELSYAALNQQANLLAQELSPTADNESPLIAIALDLGIDKVVAVLATLKAGFGYIFIDVTVLDEHIVEIIKGSRCAYCICPQSELDRYKRLTEGLCQLVTDGPRHCEQTVPNPQTSRSLDQIAYIKHTSGTTGSPKWVIHNQKTAMAIAKTFDENVGLQANDRVTLFNTFWLAISNGCLAHGATLCLFDLKKNSADQLAHWIDQNNITVLALFPTAFRRLCAAHETSERFQSVRTVFISGEAMSSADLDLTRNHFSPDCQLINCYGCSELVDLTAYKFGKDEKISGSTAPSGYPMTGVKISIDAEPDDPEGVGEIIVLSDHITSGYWGRKDLTDKTYLTDKTSGKIIGFRTGDHGWLDDRGCLFVSGRRDRQVKVNGFPVQLNDIETNILQHPGIDAAAVKSFPAEHGDNTLVAYIVPTGSAPTSSELRLFLAGKLPHYMLPDTFVELSHLPLLESGKVDYPGFKEPDAADQDLQQSDPAQPGRDSYVAPRNKVERAISVIWARTLKISPIGIKDHFFEFGGDSLGATQTVLEIEQSLGLKINLADLYENPTIEKLVPAIGASDSLRPIVIPLNGERTGTPLIFVCGISSFQALVHELKLDLPVLAIDVPDEIALIGPRTDNGTDQFDVPKLARAYVDTILKHHPTGPYRLAGFSFGGIVASEIASQLLSRGELVELIVLLDSVLPNTHKIDFLTWCKQHYKSLNQPHKLVHKAFLGTRRALKRKLSQASSIDASNGITMHPLPPEAKVVLVKAMDWPEWRKVRMPDYGWGQRLNHVVDVYEVPGDHMQIVRHPGVSELADKLRPYL